MLFPPRSTLLPYALLSPVAVVVSVAGTGGRRPVFKRLVLNMVQPILPFLAHFLTPFFATFFSALDGRFFHLTLVSPECEYHIHNLRRELGSYHHPGKDPDGVATNPVPDVQPPCLTGRDQMAYKWRAGGQCTENHPCRHDYRFGQSRNPDPPGCLFSFHSTLILSLTVGGRYRGMPVHGSPSISVSSVSRGLALASKASRVRSRCLMKATTSAVES